MINCKGNARDVILMAVTLFAVGVVFFICYFAFNRISTELLGISEVNESSHAVESLQSVENTSNKLDWVVFAIFIGLSLAIIITGYFIGGYPIFMVLYFLLLAVGVVVGMILSNVWESVSGASVFGVTIGHFGVTNHLLTYLPIYIAVVGFIGMVAMFVKPQFGGGADYGGGRDY